jgi:hypothetical protein
MVRPFENQKTLNTEERRKRRTGKETGGTVREEKHTQEQNPHEETPEATKIFTCARESVRMAREAQSLQARFGLRVKRLREGAGAEDCAPFVNRPY